MAIQLRFLTHPDGVSGTTVFERVGLGPLAKTYWTEGRSSYVVIHFLGRGWMIAPVGRNAHDSQYFLVDLLDELEELAHEAKLPSNSSEMTAAEVAEYEDARSQLDWHSASGVIWEYE